MSEPRSLDDEAGAALFMLGLTGDTKREAIGGIYSGPEGYGRTPVASSGEAAHVKGTLAKPAGTAWAALFHNHPPGERYTSSSAELFSDDDIAQARRLKLPSYISTPSGAVKVFDPTTGKVSDVLSEFPWDDYKGYLMQKAMHRAPDDPRGLLE
jgi:hypothetical protein